MFMRLARHSRLCGDGPASVCKCITLRSLSLAVKLIKVLYHAPTEGLPQFSAILHGSRWTISLTAGVTQLWQIHHAGLNIDIHTKKRERQGYGCRRTQSRRGKTLLSLFFFITQMQIKDIHQARDSPQQILLTASIIINSESSGWLPVSQLVGVSAAQVSVCSPFELLDRNPPFVQEVK